MGQKLGELVADIAAVCLGAEDLNVMAELCQKLTAGTAGGGPVLTVGVDGQTLELSVAFADCLYAGDALGADGAAKGGVFHVAAGEHAAVGTFEGGTNCKAGIGNVCVEGSLSGFG